MTKKKWVDPKMMDLGLSKTNEEFHECEECPQFIGNDHETGQGHIPGNCPHTCPICGKCIKPGNSGNHNKCEKCLGHIEIPTQS